MTYAKPEKELKLVISIGANIPSKLGDPIRTIAATRPLIEKSISDWNVVFNFPKVQQDNHEISLSFKWAPLFETDPLGGQIDQPKLSFRLSKANPNCHLLVIFSLSRVIPRRVRSPRRDA